MNSPVISMRQSAGLSRNNSPNKAAKPANTVSNTAPKLWMMLPAANPQPLEANRHGEGGADLQCGLGEAGGVAVDVAAVHGMAYLHEYQQHREQDRRRLHRAQGRVVTAPPQEVAGCPERQRRHAVTPQQPVEDRRGADRIADDARLVADTQHHDSSQNGGQHAQERDRPLHRNPG